MRTRERERETEEEKYLREGEREREKAMTLTLFAAVCRPSMYQREYVCRAGVVHTDPSTPTFLCRRAQWLPSLQPFKTPFASSTSLQCAISGPLYTHTHCVATCDVIPPAHPSIGDIIPPIYPMFLQWSPSLLRKRVICNILKRRHTHTHTHTRPPHTLTYGHTNTHTHIHTDTHTHCVTKKP